MNSTLRALVFDFGGVLVNWDPHKLFNKYFANDTRAIDDFLTEIGFTAWNLSQDKGYPFARAVIDLSARFPQYAHLIRAYDEEWEESITGTNPGAVEILYKLKSTSYRLFGMTNWSAEKFAIVRHKYAFFDLFEDIVVSGEVKLIKPDPAIFQLFMEKHDLRPEECLLIDDTMKNIQTAQSLGFATVQFHSPPQLEEELAEMGILLPA
jgi:2-haloacid dehalogenase